MQIKEYKCPNCGGAVKFDSSIQNMKCPFCDTEFEIAALEEYQKQLTDPAVDRYDWDKEIKDCSKNTWENFEQDCLSTGSCPSCGAQLIGDNNTIATVCPCCGNSQIVIKRLTGVLKPNFVIPFQLEKEDAVKALKKFYEGKRLLPNLFNKENNINGIQGVYLPFWLFDARANGHIRYKATRTKSWSDANYSYIKTDFYSVVRKGNIGFEKIPVDGSQRMDSNYMDAIEPFDYEKLKDFQTAFLSGYLAEKYDVDANECKDRAGRRIKATIENEFKKSVSGYSSVTVESSSVDVQGGKVNYSLFPVWILNTKYRKENYQFIMNADSGRLVGKLPADPGKSWKYRLLFTFGIGIISTLIIQILVLFL